MKRSTEQVRHRVLVRRSYEMMIESVSPLLAGRIRSAVVDVCQREVLHSSRKSGIS